MMRSFREYQPNERRNYITLSTGEYYPDIQIYWLMRANCILPF